MPFKSKAQQRFMFAAEADGDIPKGTAKRWAHETKSFKKLPEKVRKKTASELAHEILAKHTGNPNPGAMPPKSNYPKMNAYNPDGTGTSTPETRNFRTANIVEHGTSMEEEIPMVSALPKPEDSTKNYTDKVGQLAQGVLAKVEGGDDRISQKMTVVADWIDKQLAKQRAREFRERPVQERINNVLR